MQGRRQRLPCIVFGQNLGAAARIGLCIGLFMLYAAAHVWVEGNFPTRFKLHAGLCLFWIAPTSLLFVPLPSGIDGRNYPALNSLFGEGIMPDTKVVIPVIIGVAILVAFASGLDWLIAHPRTLFVGVVLFGGLIFLATRRHNARNRV